MKNPIVLLGLSIVLLAIVNMINSTSITKIKKRLDHLELVEHVIKTDTQTNRIVDAQIIILAE